mgnify:CR=1 FL=1
MRKEKKELIKKFKVVIEDLLDNYEEYSAAYCQYFGIMLY